MTTPSQTLAGQNGAPPVQVIGDVWRLHGAFVDPVTKAPIALSARGLVPSGTFIQPALGNAAEAEIPLTGADGAVVVVDDAGGLVDFLVFPPAQTGLTKLAKGAALPAPVRVQARLTDALGYPQTFEIYEIQPVDPKRTPLVDLVIPTISFTAVAALNVLQFPEACVFWTEFKGASIATAAQGTGQSRSSGAQEGITGPYGRFRATVMSDKAGTLTLVNEDDPALNATFAIKAGALVTEDVPAFGRSFHAVFTPSAPATVSLRDGFVSK